MPAVVSKRGVLMGTKKGGALSGRPKIALFSFQIRVKALSTNMLDKMNFIKEKFYSSDTLL